jgi:hypothetical protein
MIQELMPKTVSLKKIFLFFALLSLASCGFRSDDRTSQSSTAHQSPAIQPNDTEAVSLEWFTASPLQGTDRVSVSEAKSFINNVYQTLDDKIFDPAFKREIRQQQLKELLAQVETKPDWSRAAIADLISTHLKQLSISHVRILDPAEGATLFRLFEQEPPPIESQSLVSAHMNGNVGVLRINSFIVPQISKTAIDQAKAQLEQAKVILLDLRGNGGGDIPSLIEDIVGADKIMLTDRNRKGLALREPYIFRSYYNDTDPTGEAGAKLLEEKGYIQWRTRLTAKKDPRPYFILVDDQCGSACEAFVAIAQENGSAKILGVRTTGSALAGEAFKLNWPGFALIAPTAQVFSPKGNPIEGVGVQPNIQIPECKSDRDSDHCLEKAISVIESKF